MSTVLFSGGPKLGYVSRERLVAFTKERGGEDSGFAPKAGDQVFTDFARLGEWRNGCKAGINGGYRDAELIIHGERTAVEVAKAPELNAKTQAANLDAAAFLLEAHRAGEDIGLGETVVTVLSAFIQEVRSADPS